VAVNHSARPIALAVVLVLVGCARHTPASPPVIDSRTTGERGYIDLQAGEVLRVVVPILRSGAYVLPDSSFEQHGNTITVHDKGDFIGFERDYYDVRHNGAGIRVQFRNAEVTENGKMRVQHKAALPLIAEFERFRHVRMVLLQRVSAVDHDQALVGANDPGVLEQLTRDVQNHAGCGAQNGGLCRWVPVGISVQPVSRDNADR
jgi:hypothetical protein